MWKKKVVTMSLENNVFKSLFFSAQRKFVYVSNKKRSSNCFEMIYYFSICLFSSGAEKETALLVLPENKTKY